MRCDEAQQSIVLAQYGELADESQPLLEGHLRGCEACRREWNAYLILGERMALDPVEEPSPNLLAVSRMRLDEALDTLPARGFAQGIWAHSFRWIRFVQGAPALATLLLGTGFLSGHLLARYQEVHRPQLPGVVMLSHPAQGTVASVSGIVQTPNSNLVQVNYNKLVPETMQGSLDDPEVRKLLMLGTQLATSREAHVDSVALLAQECRDGRNCGGEGNGVGDGGIRAALLASLRSDRSAAVRLQALNGLQPYVAEDQRVRDGVLAALMHDRSADVRTEAISMLSPVGADSSVRQALRTVSSQDANPAIRNASFQALQNASDIE